MATTEKRFNLEGANTDGSINQNFEALAGVGNAKGVLFHSETKDVASIGNGAARSETFTVTGAALGDMVLGFSFGVDLAAMQATAYVSAANTVTIRLENNTGGAVDLASTTVRIWVLQMR